MRGLYAAGELVGGIFWFNYPGAAASPMARYSPASPERTQPRRRHEKRRLGRRGSLRALRRRWSRVVARSFSAWLNVPAGKDWLDVGCGTRAR